ncbi:MAG: hypothetical protein OEY89_14165 [Gammaproteobacteria bacterium]|nr:hypothetical protein [Gammaproteobacteria bacterium]
MKKINYKEICVSELRTTERRLAELMHSLDNRVTTKDCCDLLAALAIFNCKIPRRYDND